MLWEDESDPRLAAYRTPKVFGDKMTLEQAIISSRSYIQAHSSAEAQLIDPECRRSGGHIHIAKITPTDGFQWIVEPLAKQ